MIRSPAVAGSFYPADADQLSAGLRKYAVVPETPSEAIAVLAPHAGYIYSGKVAGAVYGAVRLPRRHIILCPNHFGRGAPFALYTHGEWETPLGRIPVDEELAGRLTESFPPLRHDPAAHAREHSLEVQLPFLQHLLDEFRFVPICIASHKLEDLLALGQALAAAVKAAGEPVLLVISSDMSHYLPAEAARSQDRLALEPLQRLDVEELHRTVHGRGITMCGIAPAVAGIAAARTLGARSGRLVAYANSGDTSGDYEQVVAYAGVVFS
jgi:AmmeMemoRadiSam system protein B